MRLHHPFFRRLSWNPFVVAVLFGYLAYTAYVAGFPVGRTLGAGFVGFWFALSVFDLISGHRLLDWMYASDEVTSEDTGDSRPSEDLPLVDSYLEKWDRFAQGENQLAVAINNDRLSFEAALARLLRAGDSRAVARMVFYPVVQVGGSIAVNTELGKASSAILGADFPVATMQDGRATYFGGDLYLWWEAKRSKFASYPLFDEWIKREFAQTVVIPMFRSTAKIK